LPALKANQTTEKFMSLTSGNILPNNVPEIAPVLLRPLIEAALREDLRSGDITSEALIPSAMRARAVLKLREPGVACGLAVASAAFSALDATARCELLCEEGAEVQAGTALMTVEANARALLSAERVALNFAQRLSGIATVTKAYVQAVAGSTARIIDTRKTTPGLRLLEKYAVRCGGGANHRFALDDLILIKDNHIALCGGIAAAVDRARARAGHSVKIEIECDTLDQVAAAAEAGVDIILLDNMANQELRQAVGIIGGRSLSEASGGVNLATVAAIAATGVDLISVGALTHGARSLDLGLDIELAI
jgi:nicotinate-nucleotide pyrophosphorylase (carboxylating)